MTKRKTKTRVVKARTVKARKTARAKNAGFAQKAGMTVFRQPFAVLQNGLNSVIGYFK